MKKILLLFILLSTICFGKTLKIGTTSYPGAVIMNLIKDDLKAKGIELEIVEMNDYVTPNLALADGDIDVNSFQHLPYLEQFNKDKGLDLVSAGATYICPLGLYSKKYKSLEELPEKAVIAIPNDPTNSGRALLLFHKAGLIELKDPTDLRATTFDIVKNPKNFKFKELEAAQLPRILPDVDAAVINGGYAVNAGFFPTEDSIVLEDKDSPYINIFAVRAGDENREDIKALVEAFQTDKVRDYILKTFKGGFIPVF